MGTQGVHLKEFLPWLARWARGAGTKDFYPALPALVGLVQNIFSLTIDYFTSFVLIP
jgi:hypothetical protein